jgi:hypothetical protein
MPAYGQNSRRLRTAVPILLVFVALIVVFQLSGVPSPTPPPQDSGSSTYPTNPHQLICNNLKIGDTLRINLHTLPQTANWMLASSNSGPSYIGPYFVDLGSDWFVLQGPTLMGGGNSLELLIPVPFVPALVGLEFAIQCAVVSPVASDVIFSNSVALRGSQSTAKNILIIRQTLVMAGMTTSAQQASSLAVALQVLGNQVTVVDNVLPPSLLDYDCIFDLRFSVAPAGDESQRFVQFLRQNGGIFFVSGPFAGCPPGQQRASWINVFLNTTLGIPVPISSGGGLSNITVETVNPAADPFLLTTPLSIGGMPFDVNNEGGNFGPPGTVPGGTAFLSGVGLFGAMVYGMYFEPAAMNNLAVGGRVAILFAGGADTFQASAQNPNPEFLMCNLAYFLDR